MHNDEFFKSGKTCRKMLALSGVIFGVRMVIIRAVPLSEEDGVTGIYGPTGRIKRSPNRWEVMVNSSKRCVAARHGLGTGASGMLRRGDQVVNSFSVGTDDLDRATRAARVVLDVLLTLALVLIVINDKPRPPLALPAIS